MPPKKPKPRTVLVADDDPVTVAMLTAALREAGFMVVAASDAMQAVMSTLRTHPDAIVLDVQMPGGTGLHSLERIKASTQMQQIPVVVISGSDDAWMDTKAKTKGADAFLKKPVAPADLLRVLRDLLDPEAPETPGS